METNKSMKSPNPFFITVAMAAMLVLVIFMPAVLMDMLMAVNFILSLFLFLAASFRIQTRTKGNKEENRSEGTAVLSIFPIALLLCAVFGLATYVVLTRLILISGTEMGSKIISFISGLVSADGTIGSIVGFGALIIFCAVMALITRRSSRIGKIEKQNDFLDAMNGTYKFIAGNTRVMIFIMAAGVWGNIIIRTNLHGRTIQDSAGISIAYGIGGAIFFLLPSLFLYAACGIIAHKAAERYAYTHLGEL
jgi:flagellar biosynthesis component FlhA